MNFEHQVTNHVGKVGKGALRVLSLYQKKISCNATLDGINALQEDNKCFVQVLSANLKKTAMPYLDKQTYQRESYGTLGKIR